MQNSENFEKYFVIDTNIILEDATNIIKLSKNNTNLIVIPETVLDEVDGKKSGFEEINFQAREFARLLENSTVEASFKTIEFKITRLKLQVQSGELTLDIISKEEYLAKVSNTSLNIYNDRKILEIASFADKLYDQNIEFLSQDIMARIRAVSLDLHASPLKGESKEADFDYQFIKTVEINFEEIEYIENAEIEQFDKEYQVHNYSYAFKVIDSDQVILASIQNKKIKVLQEAQIRDQIVTPLNTEQLFFSNAIMQQYYNVLIVEAKAGSGKTLLALSGALKLVRKKAYQKIIYIRNSIESLDKGEDVGYLPGYEEKFQIYNHPLMDSLKYIIRADHKKKKSNKQKEYIELDEDEVHTKVQEMILNYGIETMWVGEMRGRTLTNSFVVIDEAQNMSNKTMQMVLSRVDSSCKVVVLGSNKQIDNFYVNKHTNALSTLLNSTKNHTDYVNLFAIKLKKVLRGPITEWAESLFSNK